jgi:diguanylate cyclase (GGDEF)-like protein/PAS domain S-box-containing protein
MPDSLTDAAARLRLLYEVTSLRVGTAETRLEAALEVVTQALSLDVGVVTRIEGGTNTVAYVYSTDEVLRQGQSLPLDQTYSSLTLNSGGVLSINEIAASPHAHYPFYQLSGYESYIGAAVTVNDTLYGTLGFLGTTPCVTPFTTADEEMVVMLARWVGIALEAQINEALRRESEARFRSAFHDAAIGMAVVAPDGRSLDVNASVCKMLGYSRDELLTLDVQHITHPDDLDADLASVQQILLGQCKSYQLEKRYLHKEGHIVWGHLSVSAVQHDDGSVNYLIAQVQDITARKRYEEQVKVMAYRDELTGLHNRRYFFERVPKQLALAHQSGWPVALIYLDLNGFKEVNDTLGHQTGDELLKQVVAHLGGALRDIDIFARFGGDEFVVMLFNVIEAEARGAAERFTSCMKRPFHLSGTPYQVGVSVGVVVAPDGTTDIDALLKQADTAMYRAKGRKASEPYAIEVVRLSAHLAPN